MTLAPIALFVYNRLWHTQQTVESLQKNELADASDLFVFSDGPKSEADKDKVRAVRNYLKTVEGFRSVTVFEQERNLGLAQSIIAGITDIVGRFGKIIVLEDDIVSSQYFLRFMNEALEYYKDEDKIISIHGYIYPIKSRLPDTFFLRGADCWGWGTWKRGWELFEPDGKRLLNELNARGLTRQFDLDSSYDYTKMLEDQVSGKNDSWAIRWYASAFLKGKLTLYPGKSLVRNTGTDSSGTHCGTSNIFETAVSCERNGINAISIEENIFARKAIIHYFRSMKKSYSWPFLNFFFVINK